MPRRRNFTIGNQSPGPGHTDEIFTGGLAGISVYDTALTSAQIQAQYNAATTAVPEPSSLVLAGLAAFGAGLHFVATPQEGKQFGSAVARICRHIRMLFIKCFGLFRPEIIVPVRVMA